MPDPEITIIIPAYNEEQVIKASTARLTDYIRKNKLDCELLIVNDASTDNTDRILASVPLPAYARIITNKTREGKGKSISNAMLQSKGKTIIFLDADLSFDLDVINRLLGAIKNGADIAVGSRSAGGSAVNRSFTRKVFSFAYNHLVSIVLNSKIGDHQCGCKAFRKAVISSLLPRVLAKHWFWDTELLVLAQRKGLKVVEVPLTWYEGTYSNIDLLHDAATMLSDVVSLRLRLSR